MKTYEVDDNLNYDDLNGGSIGKVGGYGPCYERCGDNNPYCFFQEWMDLYTSCPAEGCTNTNITSWSHKGLDCGSLEISDHANIRCKGCWTVTHASKWPFPACSDHRGVPKKATYDSFTKSLNLAFKVQGNKKVMKRLLQHLFDHEDEW